MPKICYDHIFDVLSSERFLRRQGLGNELPFFICPYDAKDEIEVKADIKKLKKNLPNTIKITHVDLYDLCIELLEKRGILNQVFDAEPNTSKSNIKELLQSVFDSEKHLVPAIEEKMGKDDGCDVLFITGIGEVFPYIRSHNVLHNLQTAAKDQPTLMFFPGTYDTNSEKGAGFKLFNLFSDDKYYRAFNINHFRV